MTSHEVCSLCWGKLKTGFGRTSNQRCVPRNPTLSSCRNSLNMSDARLTFLLQTLFIAVALASVNSCNDQAISKIYAKHTWSGKLANISHRFKANGWLVHMFYTRHDMQRRASMVENPWYPRRRWVDTAINASSLANVPIDNDCGPHCTAFSYIPPFGPVTKYSKMIVRPFGAGLIFDATARLWDGYVQCASPSDGFSTVRSICGERMSNVCRSWEMPSSECKALRAGCGPHPWLKSVKRKRSQCDHPFFCSSAHWFSPPITTARSYMKHITNLTSVDISACKFRPTERAEFEAALRAYNHALKLGRNDGSAVWQSEVNMYVGPSDGHVQRALMEHLVALLYDRSMGTTVDLVALRQLQRHLKKLGKRVPIVAISMELPRSLALWDPVWDVELGSSVVELTQPPYNMQIMQ